MQFPVRNRQRCVGSPSSHFLRDLCFCPVDGSSRCEPGNARKPSLVSVLCDDKFSHPSAFAKLHTPVPPHALHSVATEAQSSRLLLHYNLLFCGQFSSSYAKKLQLWHLPQHNSELICTFFRFPTDSDPEWRMEHGCHFTHLCSRPMNIGSVYPPLSRRKRSTQTLTRSDSITWLNSRSAVFTGAFKEGPGGHHFRRSYSEVLPCSRVVFLTN